MHSKTQSKRSLLLLLVFLLGLVPGCSRPEPAKSQDDALLLSIASHARMSGDPALGEYSVLPVPVHKLSAASPTIAPKNPTEIDILVDLYSGYLNTMRKQGDLNDSSVNRMVDQLQVKISALQKRSAQLEQRRRRRGGGLGRFFRRVGRGIGRVIRRLGRAVGKAAEYLVEEVAPEVIRDMVLTGQPLTARVFWSGVRKLVRKRLKTAVGTQLARRGVPVLLLERAGLTPEENREDQGSGPETSEGTQDPQGHGEIGYGNWDLELITDDDTCMVYFEWRDFWDELPDNDVHDCRPALDSTFHVDIYLDEATSIPLTFLLDSGGLSGGMNGSGESDLAYERVNGSVTAEVQDGWVLPSADNMGWDFGGDFSVEAHAFVELRCWYEDPDPLVPGYFYWISDEKTIRVTTPFEGSTDQFVPGTEDEPGRLTPGGTLELFAGAQVLQGSSPLTELLVLCEDQELPGDFPPPFVTGD